MFDKYVRQYKTIIKVVLIIVFASLVFYFCLQNYTFFVNLFTYIVGILEPIIFGIIMAYLTDPICNWLESVLYKYLKKNKKLKNPKTLAHVLSVTLSIIFLILVILTVIMLIIPQLVSSVSSFIDHYPQYLKTAQTQIRGLIDALPINEKTQIENFWNQFNSQFTQSLTNTFLPSVSSIINNLSTGVINVARSVFNFFIGIIVAAYCLDRRKIFGLQFKKILFAFVPTDKAEEFLERAENANHIFLSFLVGKIIDSAIIGVICFFGVLFLGIPNPLLIAVIIGVTNIIPFFGPFIGAIPCVILIALETSLLKALYFTIFIFLLQQFDGNILGPKILGDSTGITSFWVLFSILLFGGLWGVVGMIIGVPLFVVIYNILKEYTNFRLEKKGLPTQAYFYEDTKDLKPKPEEEKADD